MSTEAEVEALRQEVRELREILTARNEGEITQQKAFDSLYEELGESLDRAEWCARKAAKIRKTPR